MPEGFESLLKQAEALLVGSSIHQLKLVANHESLLKQAQRTV
jgi:hypothetical protein